MNIDNDFKIRIPEGFLNKILDVIELNPFYFVHERKLSIDKFIFLIFIIYHNKYSIPSNFQINGFVNISSAKFQKFVSNYKPYLKLAEDNNLIISDRMFKPGIKSIGYKINVSLSGRLTEIEIDDYYLRKKISGINKPKKRKKK